MAERAEGLKYDITQQLDARRADLAQRFHAALLRRMHEVQLGAQPSIANPLDCAITVVEEWGKAGGAGPCAVGAGGEQFLWALERCITSQEAIAAQIDKRNPGDPYASLLVRDDIETLRGGLERLRTSAGVALPDGAKR